MGPSAASKKVVEQATERAIPCNAVSKVAEHALAAARPKTRYRGRTDVTRRVLMITLRADHLSDKMLIWALKLPR
jgi:hypothetical protein